jgi:hypothetical protein
LPVLLSLAVVVFIAFQPSLSAAEASHAQLMPQEILGVVLYADGETPVAKFPVRVWSADRRRYMFRTRTDSEGVFRIPSLGTGRAYVLVGRLKIDLEVIAREAGGLLQHHDIVVVLPRRMVFSGTGILYTPVLLAPVIFPLPESTGVVSP